MLGLRVCATTTWAPSHSCKFMLTWNSFCNQGWQSSCLSLPVLGLQALTTIPGVTLKMPQWQPGGESRLGLWHSESSAEPTRLSQPGLGSLLPLARLLCSCLSPCLRILSFALSRVCQTLALTDAFQRSPTCVNSSTMASRRAACLCSLLSTLPSQSLSFWDYLPLM